MKILLFGKNGQVGWELQRSLAPLGELIALGSDSIAPCGNLTNLEGISEAIRKLSPDIIVNAAAYTAVDKAESEKTIASLINAEAPGIMAREAKKRDALLVHYSTDYVFNGTGDEPWVETEVTAPLNYYGTTKLAGENAIKSSGCRHLIFRTSWVYASRGNNFAKTMLRLAAERDRLTVINDQIGAPTGADLIADVTAHAIRACVSQSGKEGLYHLVSAGEASWHSYALFVIEYARKAGVPLKVASDAILPVPSQKFPTPAKRPHNSRLDTTKIRDAFGVDLPLWQTGVERMLAEQMFA